MELKRAGVFLGSPLVKFVRTPLLDYEIPQSKAIG